MTPSSGHEETYRREFRAEIWLYKKGNIGPVETSMRSLELITITHAPGLSHNLIFLLPASRWCRSHFIFLFFRCCPNF